MTKSTMLLTVLGTVLVLWIALGMWRSAGIYLMQEIEQSIREHYAAHGAEGGEMPSPVRWDYEQERLVPIAPEDIREIEGSGDLQAYAVSVPEERPPLATYGIVLARIPALWFHGMFAAASLAAVILLVKVRAG